MHDPDIPSHGIANDRSQFEIIHAWRRDTVARLCADGNGTAQTTKRCVSPVSFFLLLAIECWSLSEVRALQIGYTIKIASPCHVSRCVARKEEWGMSNPLIQRSCWETCAWVCSFLYFSSLSWLLFRRPSSFTVRRTSPRWELYGVAFSGGFTEILFDRWRNFHRQWVFSSSVFNNKWCIRIPIEEFKWQWMLVIEGDIQPLTAKNLLYGHLLGRLEDEFRSVVHRSNDPERSERFSVSSMVNLLPSFVKLLLNGLSRTYHPTRVSVIIDEYSLLSPARLFSEYHASTGTP